MKKIIFFYLFTTQLAQAQITVSSIFLIGNTKTQNDIILRELAFEKNTSYATGNLDKRIEESKKNLVNLKLFNFVNINKTEDKDSIEITIDVIEKWYIWPYPIFEISRQQNTKFYFKSSKDMQELFACFRSFFNYYLNYFIIYNYLFIIFLDYEDKTIFTLIFIHC